MGIISIGLLVRDDEKGYQAWHCEKKSLVEDLNNVWRNHEIRVDRENAKTVDWMGIHPFVP